MGDNDKILVPVSTVVSDGVDEEVFEEVDALVVSVDTVLGVDDGLGVAEVIPPVVIDGVLSGVVDGGGIL